MKILYLHPDSWTGEYPILVTLKGMGHEVVVLEESRDVSPTWKRTLDFKNRGDGIETLWFNPGKGLEKILTWPVDKTFKKTFNGRNLGHRMWAVRKAVKTFKPDVAITADGYSFALPAAFLKKKGWIDVPLVTSFIGGDLLDCPHADIGQRRTPMNDKLIKASLKYPDRLRPVSPMLRRILLRDGADDAKIRVCPSHLAVSEALFAQTLQDKPAIRAWIRDRYALPQEAPVIVTLSANHKGKGMHVLAEAFSSIAEQIPEIRWLLCGPEDPWSEEAVWPILRDRGLDDRVTATGVLDAKAVCDHLAAADLNVNPALCEGLNMVVVEAAKLGLPSVTTSGAGIFDWPLKFDAGGVAEPDDAEGLAREIVAFFRENKAAVWGGNALKMAEEFTPEAVANDLIAIFREVVEGKK